MVEEGDTEAEMGRWGDGEMESWGKGVLVLSAKF